MFGWFQVYPRVVKHAVHLEKRVVKVRDNDEREDLQTVAKSYHAQLMSQKANWVSEEKYTPNMEKEERAPKTAAAEKDANPGRPPPPSGVRLFHSVCMNCNSIASFSRPQCCPEQKHGL